MPLPRRKEKDIQSGILTSLNRLPGVYLFKAGSGMFQVNGRYVRMGKVGTSDLIGWVSTEVIGPDSLRRPFARFLAIEVKQPGKKPTPEQEAFLSWVRRDGGIGVVATCLDDALKALQSP